MCFSHPQLTNYICSHCMMFYIVRKKKCLLSFGIKRDLFGLASLLHDSSSKAGYFEQKRWPGRGSSPKTACYQSVNTVTLEVANHEEFNDLDFACKYFFIIISNVF